MKCKLLYLCAASILLVGCSIDIIDSSSNGKLEHWKKFNGHSLSINKKITNTESRIYFLREKGDVKGPALNIFIDGHYLTSLLDGGYKEEIICSTGEQIIATFTTNERFTDRDTGIDYNFVSGNTEYVKVVMDKNNHPIFLRLNEKKGKDILKTLKEETQTVRRTRHHKCKKQVLGRIKLSAHSLFKFDQSNYKNMLPEGKKEITALGKKILNNHVKVSEIVITGYTDPAGSEYYNQRLSAQRAKTVKKALITSGIQVPIKTKGLGEKNLLVQYCASKYPNNLKARKQCDQPNRRVEIILYGNY